VIGSLPVKVSIVTPCLNAAAHLPDCLRSVAAQTFPRAEIEHVVVDGESTDRSAELAREAGARVLVGRDRSLYEALNKGIREARGELLVWLNADDLLLPDAVDRVVEAARAAPAAELVVGDYELREGERREVVHSPRGALDLIRSGTRGRAWVVPLVAVFRTETLRALGPYSTRHRIMGDLDMWLRAASRTPPIQEAHAGGVLGVFRVHPGSLSMGGGGEERILHETVEVARGWMEDPAAPQGVRDFARFLLRRNAYALAALRVRDRPAWRRKLATADAWLRLRRLGPGTLDDFFTNFY
jgi:glycosyltransferase involved in cell wall biosynthesis